MKKCYIVGAGDFTEPFTPDVGDLVIAADGGYDSLLKFGIRCDLLIGDLDSIREKRAEVETIRHPVKKDETDMHLAYLEGRRRGYTEFLIYGGTGGREDHTFANYSLLLYIREDGGRATLFSPIGRVTVIRNEEATFFSRGGDHFSAFALGGEARGVSISGLLYECEGVTLTPSFPLAVSNSFIGKEARIRVESGALLIMITRSEI